MSKLAQSLRRKSWRHWALGAWFLAVFIYILLLLSGNENWFEGGYGATGWIIAGLVLTSFAAQSLRFPILPWLYGFPREKTVARVAISWLIAVALFAYFLLGLANAVIRNSLFGSPFASGQASGLIYNQVMLPNGYEFGLPDMVIALVLTVVIDSALFIPIVKRRARAYAMPLLSLILNTLLWAGTLAFTLLIRAPIAIFQ